MKCIRRKMTETQAAVAAKEATARSVNRSGSGNRFVVVYCNICSAYHIALEA